MSKYHSSKLFQFITLIVISSLCLLLDSLTKIHFNRTQLPKNSPEYNVYGADVDVFSKSGKLIYRVSSDKAWKYPNDSKVYLTKVKIYFYAKGNDTVVYQINGDDGFVDPSNKVGRLGKNVVAVINSDNGVPKITFYGEQVKIDLNKNLFTSNEDIKVIRDKSIATAHGFSYDSDEEFLTLNSKVRVIYVK